MTEWVTGLGPQTLFYALVLAAARALAFVIVHPIFTRFDLQAGVLRGAVVLAISAPVFSATAREMLGQPLPDNWELIGLLGKEILIGLLLAMILGIPFWAISAAGDIIDMQRGAMMASLVDPGSGGESSPTGTLFFLFALLLVASSDWYRDIILNGIYATYAIWPVLKPLPPINPEAAVALLGLLRDILLIGVVLALPILASLLLTELSLAIIGRYLPQLNIMFIAMSLKQVVYAILLPVYFLSLIYFQQRVFLQLDNSLEILGEMISTTSQEVEE